MKKLITFALLFIASAEAQYRHHGPALLPNPIYTPGVVAITDASRACSVKWGKDARHVTAAMKREVFDRYGIKTWYLVHGKTKILMCSKTQRCSDLYEIDHLHCRENGGADAIDNLWPQPWAAPGAHQKDKVENWLHKQVCAGNISLREAQLRISKDWYAVYLSMPKKK
jgi:hypothetical protein